MKNQVNLIAVSKPSAITDCRTASELVAYTARVSNPANQSNKKTAKKLLQYLIKENHWSPFEMVHMTMEIKTTRDIGRQILRHRSFAFQEFSQRYAVSENIDVVREARLQDDKNRQNSIVTDDKHIEHEWSHAQARIRNFAKKEYEAALKMGIAKEQARALLPEGLTETTLYMAGSLRSWIHYCDLRRANGTQKEHMEVAQACWDIVLAHFPEVGEITETKEVNPTYRRVDDAGVDIDTGKFTG
jgi:thymidylate synthase (FAD)|tara:strand:+ start:641 stop:1372 length:732 start_codon:yes stop_codon:yes gene_type:complete